MILQCNMTTKALRTNTTSHNLQFQLIPQLYESSSFFLSLGRAKSEARHFAVHNIFVTSNHNVYHINPIKMWVIFIFTYVKRGRSAFNPIYVNKSTQCCRITYYMHTHPYTMVLRVWLITHIRAQDSHCSLHANGIHAWY